MWAVIQGELEMFRMLLGAGANCAETTTKSQRNVLHFILGYVPGA